MDSASARHVIKRISKPRLLGQMASYDAASTIMHQSLPSALVIPLVPGHDIRPIDTGNMRAAQMQRLTFVHFSAQRKHFL
jgi:hypothetical protein